LLLTLVVMVLLTAVIVEFDYGAKVNLITAGNFRDEIQATYLAKSGVAAARAVLKDDARLQGAHDDLTEFWARPFPPYPVGDGFVSVEITDEAGKIDINRLGAPQTSIVSQGTQEMLKRLLRVLEVESDLIDPIVEAIRNWVDPDVSHDCTEDIYYQRLDPPYRCKKGPMDTLSELLLVKGVTPEFYRKIRPYLTTVSVPAKPININTAGSPVLQALSDDITSDTAICIQTGRPYTTINNDVWTACATSCLANPSCRNPIGVKSNFFTVKAHGIMHETDKVVTALIERDKNKIISWQIE
jgi:general secretion pathway protein K